MSSTQNRTLPVGSRNAVPVGTTPLEVARSVGQHLNSDDALELCPTTKLGIGPPVSDGFSCDFDKPSPVALDDQEETGAKTRKIRNCGGRVNNRARDAQRRKPPFELVVAGIAGLAVSKAFRA